MSPQFARRHGVPTIIKKEPLLLMAVDEKPLLYNDGMVARETNRLPLTIGRHSEELQFDITEALGCDVVLGLPWLKGSDQTIN